MDKGSSRRRSSKRKRNATSVNRIFAAVFVLLYLICQPVHSISSTEHQVSSQGQTSIENAISLQNDTECTMPIEPTLVSLRIVSNGMNALQYLETNDILPLGSVESNSMNTTHIDELNYTDSAPCRGTSGYDSFDEPIDVSTVFADKDGLKGNCRFGSSSRKMTLLDKIIYGLLCFSALVVCGVPLVVKSTVFLTTCAPSFYGVLCMLSRFISTSVGCIVSVSLSFAKSFIVSWVSFCCLGTMIRISAWTTSRVRGGSTRSMRLLFGVCIIILAVLPLASATDSAAASPASQLKFDAGTLAAGAVKLCDGVKKSCKSSPITLEEMRANMQKDIDCFKARHENRCFKTGERIKWVLPILPDDWKVGKLGKVLFNLLHYDPMERHDAMGGVHSGKATGKDGELENASVYFLQSVVSKALFEGACFGDYFPFPIPYNKKPEDVLSARDLNAIMNDWNQILHKWFTDRTNYPHLTFYLASQAVVGHVAEKVFCGEVKLNAFHKDNAGRFFSLSLLEIITSYHPEWFHNIEYGRKSGEVRWTAGCITLDKIGNMIRGEFGIDDPCSIGEQYLLREFKTPEAVRLAKLELENNPKEWLIVNCRSSANVVTDESVPVAIKRYLSKQDWLEVKAYLSSKGVNLTVVNQVRVKDLHSYMCHVGGVASGKIISSAKEKKDMNLEHTWTKEEKSRYEGAVKGGLKGGLSTQRKRRAAEEKYDGGLTSPGDDDEQRLLKHQLVTENLIEHSEEGGLSTQRKRRAAEMRYDDGLTSAGDDDELRLLKHQLGSEEAGLSTQRKLRAAQRRVHNGTADDNDKVRVRNAESSCIKSRTGCIQKISGSWRVRISWHGSSKKLEVGTFATKEEAEVANAAALEVLNAVNADPTKEEGDAIVKRAMIAANDLAFDCIVATDLATDKLVGNTPMSACFCEVGLNQTKANECYVKNSKWFAKVNSGNFLLCRLCKDKGLSLDKCLKKKHPKHSTGTTSTCAAHLRRMSTL